MRAAGSLGFTLIELLGVVAILGILAAIAIGAYTKNIRNAHKSEVLADMANLTLRQKSFFAINGHYASSTDAEGAEYTYPLATSIASSEGELQWNPTDAGYTASGASDDAYFRGGADVHGFDALRFMPEGGRSHCGYATISGWGADAMDEDAADTPPSATLASQIFPEGSDAYVARDWFYSYALCDFDRDQVYWAFTTAHYTSDISAGNDTSGTYLENE